MAPVAGPRRSPAPPWRAPPRRGGRDHTEADLATLLLAGDEPGLLKTTRCLVTAWRVNGTFSANELAVDSPPSTSRSSTRRREGSAMADHSWSSVPWLIRRGGEQVLEAAEERLPAVTVLRGVAGLVVVGPADGVETRLGDPQSGPLGALRYKCELDQDGVARHGRLALGVAPAEREPQRRFDRDHHQRRRAILPSNTRVPAPPVPQVELDLVGEPPGDLVGLGDGAPHDVGGRIDDEPRARCAGRPWRSPPAADELVAGERGRLATLEPVLEAQQVGGPRGAAVVHELDRLAPAGVGEEHHGLVTVGPQVEREGRVLPFRRAPGAAAPHHPARPGRLRPPP